MPRLTSFDYMCFPREMMTCHTWPHPIVCTSQGLWWHSWPDVVRPCMLSKGYASIQRLTLFDRVLSKGEDGMSRVTSSICVCFKIAIMAWHARGRLTVCVVQSLWWHFTPDNVWSCVLSKGYDGMPHSPLFDHLCCQRVTRVCHVWLFCTKLIMASHIRLCEVRGQW